MIDGSLSLAMILISFTLIYVLSYLLFVLKSQQKRNEQNNLDLEEITEKDIFFKKWEM